MFKNWQYHAVRAIGRFVCLFSYDTIVAWGRKLGPFVGRLLKKQRNRGIFHVMRGMKCSEAEAIEIIDGVFANLGQSLMEILYTPKLNKADISDYVTLDRTDILEAALEEKKGVIALTGHIGNWEWMGASLALYGYPATTIVKNQPNDSVTRFLNENRERMGLEVFARGGNEMILPPPRPQKKKRSSGFWLIRTAVLTACRRSFWANWRRHRAVLLFSPDSFILRLYLFFRIMTGSTATVFISAIPYIMSIRVIKSAMLRN